ncbi:putative membrane protein YccC [Rhodoblastus acidophilus]|uniref:FUSC family protein n=1 Tax=Rhodoblastus acidophilus TaxID=1074 RepID=UPI002224C038|nr:FUSC family protein [Rhodoblastus acidophilus]MCW2316515.1 putative membrane protein YccC [Rhodoblastus acidophilus]
MRIPPSLFKYLLGQHILNGYAVALGVLLVGLGVGALQGFDAALAAASGALCVSVGDTPSPLSSKLRILPICWCSAVAASLLTALADGSLALEAAAVTAIGFVAGLQIAWGRWAIPLSILTQLAMVFTLGAPGGKLEFCQSIALGGALYIPIALTLTRLLDASGRRVMLAELIREFATLLRRMADFYRPGADEGAACLKVVEQQASFSDQLQAARSLSVYAANPESGARLIAALAVLLEAFDGMISTMADHAPLRLASAQADIAGRVETLLRQVADDLDALSLDLLIVGRAPTFPDHATALESLAEEIADLDSADPRVLRAARMTRARLAWALNHLARIPAVVAEISEAEKALAGLDLTKFAPPLRVSLAPIRAELRWASPVFRHALRLSAALACGYALIAVAPELRHGNWILLTIAVIMRASYSATTQRRDQRLFGSVVGCGIAGALLWLNSKPLLLFAQLSAVGIAHSFGRVDYRVTSVAASVMALLGLHLLDPGESAPVVSRLIDTVIGAGVAFLFNFMLPNYERHGARALANAFLDRLASYADKVLRWDVAAQDYRLARKALIESFSSLGESSKLARDNPGVGKFWPRYSKLIAQAYFTAAQIVTIRLLIRNRIDELDARDSAALLDDTRAAVLAQLRPSCAQPPPTCAQVSDESDAAAALRLRCAEAAVEAGRLRRLAAELGAA